MRVYFDGHPSNFKTFDIYVEVRDPCLTAIVTLMYENSFLETVVFNTQVDTEKNVWLTQNKADAISLDDLTVCPCFEFDIVPNNNQTLDTDIFLLAVVGGIGGCENTHLRIH